MDKEKYIVDGIETLVGKTYFDDSATILKRVAAAKNVPSYLYRYDGTKIYSLEYEVRYEKFPTYASLLGSIPVLLNMFPALNTVRIVTLWYKYNFKQRIQILESLKGIDAYRDIEQLKTHLETTMKEDTSVEKDILERFTGAVLASSFNPKKFPVTINPGAFIPESVSSVYQLQFADPEEPLSYIFDRCQVSKYVPFIFLITETGRRFWKVYTEMIPDETWITFDPLLDLKGKVLKDLNTRPAGIYFRVYQANDSYFTSNRAYPVSLYTLMILKPDHRLLTEAVIVKYKISESDIFDRFLTNTFGTKPTILSKYDFNMKGEITLSGLGFKQIIFQDIIMNDPILSYYMFMPEKGKHIGFGIYFKAAIGIREIGLLTTLNLVTTQGNPNISIKISKARNFQEIDSYLRIFSLVLGYYQFREPTIYKIYESALGVHLARAEGKYIEHSKVGELKTKKRLGVLQKYDKPLFYKTNYARKCQKRQPLPYVGSDIKEILAHKVPGKDPHKYIEFPRGSGKYYTSDPPDSSGAAYIGLIDVEPDAKSSFPDSATVTVEGITHYLAPCCFAKDQYEEKSSLLAKYFGFYEERKVSGTRPYLRRAEIAATRDKYAYLPLSLLYIFWNHISVADLIMIGDKESIPFVRKGVEFSPDSFLRCCLYIYGRGSSPIDRQDDLEKLRKSLISFVQQGKSNRYLQNTTKDKILEMLTNENLYVDPLLFADLVSDFFGKNILIISMTKNVTGICSYPISERGYIPSMPYSENVLMTVFKDDKHILAQCEIVVNFKNDNPILKDNYADLTKEIFETCYKVYFSTKI